jgi:hypothetical protein
MTSKSNNEYECPHCHQWITTLKGGYSKHIRSCRARLDTIKSQKVTIVASNNPLLSCSVDTQIVNKPYDSYQYKEDDFSIKEDSDNYHDNDLDYGAEYDDDLDKGEDHNMQPKYQQHYKQRKTASINKFQIMLLDIIYKHKASLRMYDGICQLVYEYSSSSDFDRHARLQSRKSIL